MKYFQRVIVSSIILCFTVSLVIYLSIKPVVNKIVIQNETVLSLCNGAGILKTYNGKISGISQREQVAKCNDVIHVAIVTEDTRDYAVTLKSLLLHTGAYCSLRLYVVTSKSRMEQFQHLLDTWEVSDLESSLHFIDDLPQWQDLAARELSKLLLHLVLPDSVEKIIVLDSSVVLIGDIYHLWQERNALLGNKPVLAACEDDCTKMKNQNVNNAKCILTEIMLINLATMRTNTISALTKMFQHNYSNIIDQICLLPCEWNVRCDRLSCSRCMVLQKSGYSAKKIVDYIDGQSGYIRQPSTNLRYQVDLYLCESVLTTEQVCEIMRRQVDLKFRTNLYYFGEKYINNNQYDVTLVTQLSTSRYNMLIRLLEHWQGPVSATVYGNDEEVLEFKNKIEEDGLLKDRPDVSIHTVYRRENVLYPIGYLRNVAFNNIKTQYVFLCDVDFTPSFGLHRHLERTTRTVFKDKKKIALVIASFEEKKSMEAFPRDKSSLEKLYKSQVVTRFHDYYVGHCATDYKRWFSTDLPYKVDWEKNYEPYIMVHKDAPRYNERFIGYGYNKITQIAELHARGYEFLVLPNEFIIHRIHAETAVKRSFTKFGHIRSCIDFLRLDFFNNYLPSKYGEGWKRNNVYGRISSVFRKLRKVLFGYDC